jgi:hypothetical protein
LGLNIDSDAEIGLDVSIQASTQTESKSKVHEKQLVSEIADVNEDN